MKRSGATKALTLLILGVTGCLALSVNALMRQPKSVVSEDVPKLLQECRTALERVDRLRNSASEAKRTCQRLLSAAEACEKLEGPNAGANVRNFGKELKSAKVPALTIGKLLQPSEGDIATISAVIGDDSGGLIQRVQSALVVDPPPTADDTIELNKFKEALKAHKAQLSENGQFRKRVIDFRSKLQTSVAKAFDGIKSGADRYGEVVKEIGAPTPSPEQGSIVDEDTIKAHSQAWIGLEGVIEKLRQATGFLIGEGRAEWPLSDKRTEQLFQALDSELTDFAEINGKSDGAASAIVSARLAVQDCSDEVRVRISSETTWTRWIEGQCHELARSLESGIINPYNVEKLLAHLQTAQSSAVRLAVTASNWSIFFQQATNTSEMAMSSEIKRIGSTAADFALSVANLNQALAGNAADWVTERVNLYFFTDVRRLLTVLNEGATPMDPVGKVSSDFAGKQRLLRSAQSAVREAYDLVNQYTNELVNLEPKLAAAQAVAREKRAALVAVQKDLAEKRKVKSKSAADLKKIQDRILAITEELKPDLAREQRVQLELELSAKRQEEANATEVDANAQTDVDSSNQALTLAQSEYDVAQARVSENVADSNSLPNKIAAAQTNLANKARDLKSARDDVNLAAENALDEFAIERDNQPFIRALGYRYSTDPVKRCTIYGFDDAKTLLLRGKKADVNYTRDVIAQFDRPAPQARLTLWTLQMSVQASRQVRLNLGNALERVDKELSKNREVTALVASVLRDELNRVVREVERSGMDNRKTNLINRPERHFAFDAQRIARSAIYNEEVAWQLGLATSSKLKYRHEGGPPAFLFPDYYYFTRWTLPDPSATTTLGETLMILALAKKPYQCRILTAAKNALAMLLKGKDVSINPGSCLRRLGAALSFPASRQSCSQDRCECDDDGLTSQQKEITQALKRSAFEKFIASYPQTIQLVGDLLRVKDQDIPDHVRRVFGVRSTAQGQSVMQQFLQLLVARSINPEEWEQVRDRKDSLQKVLPSRAGNIETAVYLAPAIVWLSREFGVTSSVFSVALDKDATDDTIQARWRDMRYTYPRDQANARIAAADEMLKHILMAIEDDVDELAVQPMLSRVRRLITGAGVDVGLLERTSVLSTNRNIVRVDPSASAQLDLGGEQRLLEAAEQLAQIVTAVQTKKSPRELIELGKHLDKEPPGELYALTSGAQFKVTPIFEPTGQALRFQFDYIKTTQITEPDGTTNPRLPRVDRHAVNAIVQLSNLEVREISRFEVNSKLGIPKKQWGGIPILKDLPILEDLPIIGWFSRKSGRAAVSQASLILGQTAMYPTIEDIANLLTNPIGIPPLSAGHTSQSPP